jgi:hypothetical protein
MQAPDRLTAPTCIGCGAMSQFGTCASGRTEQKLELVRAAVCEWLAEIESRAQECAEGFRAVTEQLVQAPPVSDDWECAYRSVQKAARAALRRDRELVEADGHRSGARRARNDLVACTVRLSTRRNRALGSPSGDPFEWVNQATYVHQHDRTLAEHDQARRLRHLVRRIATITPRPGGWERGWRALQAEALQGDHQR